MELVILGDEHLTERSEPVTEFDDNLANIVQKMFKVMKLANGIGLAAPQVGIQKRFFIVQIDDEIERVFVNPQIIETSQEMCTMEEGCLSIPKYYAKVERAESVVVQFADLNGKIHTIKADGLLARVIQHENDHLNGVLFIDRISAEKKEEAIAFIEKNRKAISKKIKVRSKSF